MPLKVRCRCGQELVLRYGEWVYISLAIVFLALLANTGAVILLFSSLQGLERTVDDLKKHDQEDRSTSRATSSATEQTPDRSRSSTTGRPDSAEPIPEERRTDESTVAETIVVDRETPIRSIGGSASEDGDAVRDLIQLLTVRREHDLETITPRPTANRPPSKIRTGLTAGPALLRLLLVRSSADEDLVAAHVLDEDDYVRKQAIDVLTKRGVFRRRLESDSSLALILGAAGQLLRGVPGADRWLGSGATIDDDLWRQLQERGRNAMSTLPEIALGQFLEPASTRGLDVVLAIDTTQSMDAVFGDLSRTASWLLPALSWGIPGSRVGLLLYKDDVETTIELSTEPARDLLPALVSVTASGGGDVPEGVYTALRGALELGRFQWRPGAEKHIVIIGDQGPRFDEKRPFESLARAAHEDGRFRIHTLALTKTGQVPVAFFRDFAEAGHGRHSACAGSDLAKEIVKAVLPESYAPLAERVTNALHDVFAK